MQIILEGKIDFLNFILSKVVAVAHLFKCFMVRNDANNANQSTVAL